MEESFVVLSVWVSLTIVAWIVPKKLKKKIEEDFSCNPEVLPPDGKKAGKLITVNFIGATLFGRFRHYEKDSMNTVVSYYFICFVIPLIPLGCYRVIEKGNKYYFIGSDHMKAKELLCIYLDALKWVLSIFTGLGLFAILSDGIR